MFWFLNINEVGRRLVASPIWKEVMQSVSLKLMADFPDLLHTHLADQLQHVEVREKLEDMLTDLIDNKIDSIENRIKPLIEAQKELVETLIKHKAEIKSEIVSLAHQSESTIKATIQKTVDELENELQEKIKDYVAELGVGKLVVKSMPPIQKKLLDIIEEKEKISFKDLKDRSRLASSTLSHHLSELTNRQKLNRVRRGVYQLHSDDS